MKKTISGIRGIVGDDLMLEDVIYFCNNFARTSTSDRCVVARDTRPSGESIKDVASAALMQNGMDVLDLGVSPTPVLYYEARKHGAGAMISASHNPIKWNGMKFVVDGRGINEEELRAVTSEQTPRKTRIGVEKGCKTDYEEAALRTIGAIKDPPRAVVDIGGGAAGKIAPNLLERLGCKVSTINKDLDDTTRGPDPTVESLDELVAECASADIGFAFDLDGDRVVTVMDGQRQASDVTLGLGIVKALEMGCRKFVLSMDTSVAVEKIIRVNGGSVARSKVGEANVVDMMLKTGAQAGGEGSSAGFIFPEFNLCRDGILTSGLIASMIKSSKSAEALSFMKRYHGVREKIPVDSRLHDSTIKKVGEEMKRTCGNVITLDGVKGVMDDNTWVLVRKSNTEDAIRISAESNDREKALLVLSQAREAVIAAHEQIE